MSKIDWDDGPWTKERVLELGQQFGYDSIQFADSLRFYAREFTDTELPSHWWEGESRWRWLSGVVVQPKGPFWHWSPAVVGVGELLLSPAERKELPRFGASSSRLSAGKVPLLFDEHAVYVQAGEAFHAGPYVSEGNYLYEVIPEGELWPDPERRVDMQIRDWCTTRARVVRLVGDHTTTNKDTKVESDTLPASK